MSWARRTAATTRSEAARAAATLRQFELYYPDAEATLVKLRGVARDTAAKAADAQARLDQLVNGNPVRPDRRIPTAADRFGR